MEFICPSVKNRKKKSIKNRLFLLHPAIDKSPIDEGSKNRIFDKVGAFFNHKIFPVKSGSGGERLRGKGKNKESPGNNRNPKPNYFRYHFLRSDLYLASFS